MYSGMKPLWLLIIPCLILGNGTVLQAQSNHSTLEETRQALEKSIRYFHEHVSIEGGYVWRYSADLSKREGEGKVGPTTAWTQYPGTPFVGETLLTIAQRTDDPFVWETAHASAMALVRGQLQSGGWAKNIEFTPEERKKYAYRVDENSSSGARDTTTLDDDMTQSALRYLILYDQATDFRYPAIHEAAVYGLQKLREAQFPNGAWPHVFRDEERNPDDFPVVKASYRDDENHTRIKEHWRLYTLNDRLMTDVIKTMILAYQVYGNEDDRNAVRGGGDFLILAQMPDPQPGWAQQYDFQMHPAWARRFEPPAITGSESQQVMMTLMDVYEFTGDRRYLAPIAPALEYYKDSLLSDGRLARFYELKTNRPLYFTLDYELTYRDDDLPTHYAFKVGSQLGKIESRYTRLANTDWEPQTPSVAPIPEPSAEDIAHIIARMDDRGAWVEEGRLRYWGDDDPTTRIISPQTFAQNALALTNYIYHFQSGKQDN